MRERARTSSPARRSRTARSIGTRGSSEKASPVPSGMNLARREAARARRGIAAAARLSRRGCGGARGVRAQAEGRGAPCGRVGARARGRRWCGTGRGLRASRSPGPTASRPARRWAQSFRKRPGRPRCFRRTGSRRRACPSRRCAARTRRSAAACAARPRRSRSPRRHRASPEAGRGEGGARGVAGGRAAAAAHGARAARQRTTRTRLLLLRLRLRTGSSLAKSLPAKRPLPSLVPNSSKVFDSRMRTPPLASVPRLLKRGSTPAPRCPSCSSSVSGARSASCW